MAKAVIKKTEIFQKILVILTEETRIRSTKGVKLEDKIRKYVPAIDAMNLALAVVNNYKEIDINELLNKLFDDINTLKELRDYIFNAYDEA